MQKRSRANRFYYGWYIAVTLAITETISWGIIYYAFSVFLTPMEAEFGWSRTEMSGAFSLALVVSAGMAFPVGNWIDRHGARLLMSVGSIGATILVLAWSQVNDLRTLYLIWIGLGICAAMLLYEPAFAVVAAWFVKRRGRALALVTFMAGLASTIFVPLSDGLMRAFGWRSALIALAVVLGATTIPLHILMLRRRPADLGLLPDGGQKSAATVSSLAAGVTLKDALASKSFWMLTAAFMLSNLSSVAIRFHLIPFMIAAGFSSGTAALASGSIGILQVVGRVIFAPLDTRLPTRRIAACLFALEALALGILLISSSAVGVGLFLIIFGTSYGAKTLARPSLLAEYFGLSHYARISSVMVIFLTLTTTVAPVGASFLYDEFGTYQPVLILIVGISLAATSVTLFIKPVSPAQPTPSLIPNTDLSIET